ncbi:MULTISPECIES: hypothetical protein [Actinokineospora]|uniref:PPE family domain-containing protein n=1 Tax=Actinokineospora fastidiosa TaxID=1816 RepID=A0A918G3T0_9PSEU|nr:MULTISPECIES: hypothetical protein [Actinokineospora]UVS76639.1 hypothetical protein Actkin_00333 [Actinokineospora sp. UTMC 2448]GGS16813.1 hypothetical protein GCM10010171_06340 [Actinokineospora fastidiosa]
MPNGDQPRYETHDYAGDRADDVSIAMRNMPEEDRSTTTELQQSIAEYQREQLAPDVEMGNDRVVVPQNWESRTSTELYAAATEKNVPTSADGLGRGFTEGGNRLAEAANRLLDAVTRLEHAWQGEAADAARNALKPLAQRTGQAGISAQYMGTAMSDQALAAATVRNMPEPMEFDRDAELTKALANPNPVAGMNDMQAKEEQARAVKAEQVKYMTEYTNTMAEIDSRTPTFVPPPPRSTDTGGGDGFQDGTRVTYDRTGSTDSYTPRGSTGDGDSRPGFIDGHHATNPHTVPPAPGYDGLDTGTDLSGYTPPQTSPVQPPVTVNPTPGPGPQPGPTQGPGPFSPVSTGPTGPTGGRSLTGGPRGPFGGGPGGPGGAGGPGAKPGLGAGMGQGGPGAGGRPGGAGAGAGGAGRGAGAGAGAGAGGRGGQGDEDLEHQRPSYLVEPDPEDTFGTDQITAPSVIGE